ncbi:hypothetical protein P691DRAFT_725109, partial [Macrolepiota fuliginosa MF-IS2]
MLSEPLERDTTRENEDQPQDDDSLFGSPPPSPLARGRSPSPTLALSEVPLAGLKVLSSGSSQNVGTIALPGSHAHSEQSINPIALSLSLPGGTCAPLLPQSLPPSQPQSRQGSIGRNDPPRPVLQPRSQSSAEIRRKPQTRKRKQTEPITRPSPPSIPFPDPSQPLPPHFLRSQQALLGHAGLIAGVRPSKLATSGGTSRGTSPSNPIVLDDHEAQVIPEPPLIGRSHVSYFKNLDPSKLPKPSNQEIVEMLIKQKDIFPVLENILKLLATGALGGRAAAPNAVLGTRLWASRPDQSRTFLPAKRRKLNQVPAGAADWDVPYPFQEGEGPAAYRQNWVRERGRQLISQLIGLVKVAARKAAAKKHLVEVEQKRQELPEEQKTRQEHGQSNAGVVNRQEGGRGANHYRHETGGMTLPVAQSPLQDEGNSELLGPEDRNANTVGTVNFKKLCHLTVEPGQSPTVPPSTDEAAPTTSFNSLFSALLAASDTKIGSSFGFTPPPTPPLLEPLSQLVPDSLPSSELPSNGNIDQSLIDSWMNILQTFPLQADNFCSGSTPPSENVSLGSLFGLASPADMSSFASPVNGYLSSFSTTPNPDAQQAQNFPLDFNQLDDLDLALNLTTGGASTSDTLGTLSSSTGDTPMDLTFDLSSLTQDASDGAQAPNTEHQVIAMDVDATSFNLSFPSITPSRSDNIGFNNLIDRQLLATSPSEPRGSSMPRATIQDAQSVTSTNEPRSPSTFLPSPISSFEPATPSSAGWDT